MKHAQCFDVALTDEGSVVLASKDYRIYLYRYMDVANPAIPGARQAAGGYNAFAGSSLQTNNSVLHGRRVCARRALTHIAPCRSEWFGDVVRQCGREQYARQPRPSARALVVAGPSLGRSVALVSYHPLVCINVYYGISLCLFIRSVFPVNVFLFFYIPFVFAPERVESFA